jgi:hypothetical protein
MKAFNKILFSGSKIPFDQSQTAKIIRFLTRTNEKNHRYLTGSHHSIFDKYKRGVFLFA